MIKCTTIYTKVLENEYLLKYKIVEINGAVYRDVLNFVEGDSCVPDLISLCLADIYFNNVLLI